MANEIIGKGLMSNDPETCAARFSARNPIIDRESVEKVSLSEKIGWLFTAFIEHSFRFKNIFPLPIPDCYDKQPISPSLIVDSRGTEVDALMTNKPKPHLEDYGKVILPDVKGYFVKGQPIYK